MEEGIHAADENDSKRLSCQWAICFKSNPNYSPSERFLVQGLLNNSLHAHFISIHPTNWQFIGKMYRH